MLAPVAQTVLAARIRLAVKMVLATLLQRLPRRQIAARMVFAAPTALAVKLKKTKQAPLKNNPALKYFRAGFYFWQNTTITIP
jgi:hypothetical protein